MALALNESHRHSLGKYEPRRAVDDDDDEAEANSWIEGNSLLFTHVFRSLDVDPKAWPGLVRTAASGDAELHLCAFLNILSEGDESEGEEEEEEDEKKGADRTGSLEWNGTEKSDNEGCEEPLSASNWCNEDRSGSKSGASHASATVDADVKRQGQDGAAVQATDCLPCRSFADPVSFEKADDKEIKESGRESGDGDHDVRDQSGCVRSQPPPPITSTAMAISNRPTDIDDRQNEGEGSREGGLAMFPSTSSMMSTETGPSSSSRAAAGRARIQLRLPRGLRRIDMLLELVQVCVADDSVHDSSETVPCRGYDARARVALRLIAAWFGLAAPAIGAGVAAFTTGSIAAAATAASTTVGSAAVAGAFGAAGAGLTGYRVARRTAGISEFSFQPIGDNHSQGCLAVTILVSGLIHKPEDFVLPWEGPDGDAERFALIWETEHLLAVTTALRDWMTSQFANELVTRGAALTVLHALFAAIALPSALLSLTSMIDSRWAIVLDRPVTLVGFSLGARLIFSCLEELAIRGDSAGIVERVVLLGGPIPIDEKRWQAVREIVAGRFVNGYSSNDWNLGIVYRASILTHDLAGVTPVEVPGVENVNLAKLVKGHSSYLKDLPKILDVIDIDSPLLVSLSSDSK
ncbi:hypothetical protein CBR_g46645 [Chara braunii]|uniref:DUF726 domain-containing protein n=1 Tax=Chara braunii TaxID=69332 RepID=A0A388M0S9_CHABU|nr:hypothetical protein CBR_g46645 [Chara braunii]|eukprot:GBG88156.1 hypothetical protein CBR_g46645 [Chara braunii]